MSIKNLVIPAKAGIHLIPPNLCRTVPVWTHRICARDEMEGAINLHL